MEKKIYDAIVSKANEVFENMQIPAGRYSAKEVKTSSVLGFEKIYELDVDGFKCSFTNESVFTLLETIEKQWKIPSKERAVFVKESAGEQICSFVVPKSIGKLAKCADSAKSNRPVLQQVYLDTKIGALVATDGFVLDAKKVDVTMFAETDGYILLPPSVIKAGNVVNVTKDKYDYVFANDIECLSKCRYPNWTSVVHKYDTPIRFGAKKYFTAFQKAVKEAKKHMDTDETVILCGNAGESFMTVKTDTFNCRVAVAEALTKDIVIGFNPDYVLKVFAADGVRLFVKSSDFAMVFASAERVTLIMPKEITARMAESKDCDIDVLEFAGFIQTETPATVETLAKGIAA